MTNQIIKPQQVTTTRYDGGENAVIVNGDKAVSVCRTDYGLFDVQADNGKILYTGHDADEAAEATRKHLGE